MPDNIALWQLEKKTLFRPAHAHELHQRYMLLPGLFVRHSVGAFLAESVGNAW